MPEGAISINTAGVFKTGDVDFDITWDITGVDPVTHVSWGTFKDWEPTNWKVETSGGKFTRPSNTNVLVGDNLTGGRKNCIVTVPTLPDLNVEANITVLQSNTIVPQGRLITRYKDEGNYYFAGLGTYGYKGAIGKYTASNVSMIAHSIESGSQSGINIGTPYTVKLTSVGEYLFLYINDIFSCWTKDASNKTGRIGISTYNSKTQYDNFKANNNADGTLAFQDTFGDFTKEVSFYIINKAISPIECTASAINIVPTELTQNMAINWDLDAPIENQRVERVTLKMDILPAAPAGDFTYNLVVNGRTIE